VTLKALKIQFEYLAESLARKSHQIIMPQWFFRNSKNKYCFEYLAQKV